MAGTLDVLIWLSGHAHAQGRPLEQGNVVITGARIGPLALGGSRRAVATAMDASVWMGSA